VELSEQLHAHAALSQDKYSSLLIG